MGWIAIWFRFPVAVAGDTYFATYSPEAEEQRTIEQWQERTQFISKALRNTSFIASMEELRITGFAVLTDHAGLDLMSTKGDESWLKRAQLAGLANTNLDHITSLLEYDPTSDIFMPKTQVVSHLREKLKEQNTTGLDEKQKGTAGAITSFEAPIAGVVPYAPPSAGHAFLPARQHQFLPRISRLVRILLS